jgi:uncharacterized surface protein with fasciclin (FAS1) repeats
MKNLFKIKNIAFVLFVALLGASCTKTESTIGPATAKTESITGFIAKNENLSTLLKALKKTGLDKTLDGPGTFTVFMPTNTAFEKFLGDKGTIENTDIDVLTNILNNHVFSSVKKLNDLNTGYIETLSKGPVDGSKLSLHVINVLNNKAKVITFNSVSPDNTTQLVQSDITASNGVMHVVNVVIGFKTVFEQILDNPTLSTLVAASTSTVLNKKGYGEQSAVATALTKSTTPITVFAPSNDAFKALEVDLKAAATPLPVTNPLSKLKTVKNLAPADITKILQYHVTSGNVLAASLTEGKDVITLNTQTFKIGLVGGATILDAKGRKAPIATTDIQCTNGVIHLIEKVVLPTGIVLPF